MIQILHRHHRHVHPSSHILSESISKWKLVKTNQLADSLGQSWTVLDSFGQSWTVLDSLGQSWTVLDSLGQSWTVLGSLGQSWTALDRQIQSNQIQTCWRFPIESIPCNEIKLIPMN